MRSTLAAALTTAAAATLLASCSSGDTTTTARTEFTDRFGRQCTQVVARSGVALDCDHPAAESRLGSALEGLVQP